MSVAFKLNELKQTWIGYAQELLQRDDIGKIIDKLIEGSESLQTTVNALTPVVSGLVNILSDLIGVLAKLAEFGDWTIPAIAGVGGAAFIQNKTGILNSIANPEDFDNRMGKAKNWISSKFSKKDVVSDAVENTYDTLEDQLEDMLENALQEQIQRAADADTEIMGNSSEMMENLKDNFGEVNEKIEEFSEIAEDAGKNGDVVLTTITKKLKSIGAILTSPTFWGIAAVVALTAALYKLSKAQEEIIEQAKKAEQEYSNNQKTLDEYKNKIETLRKQANDMSLSIETQQSAREQLLDIQSQMIKQFGDEAAQVDILRDSIDRLNGSFDILSEKSYQEFLNSINRNEGISGWFHKLYTGELFDSSINNMSSIQDEMENATSHLKGRYGFTVLEESKLKPILENKGLKIEGEGDYNRIVLSSGTNLQDYYDTLLEIQIEYRDKREELGEDEYNDLVKEASRVKQLLDSISPTYNRQLEHDTIYPQYGNEINNLKSAMKELRDAQIKGDEEAINSAGKNLADMYNGLIANIDNPEILNWFEDFIKEYSQIINRMNFLNGKGSNVKYTGAVNLGKKNKYYKEELEEMANWSDEAVWGISDNQKRLMVQAIKNLAKEYNIPVTAVIDQLEIDGAVFEDAEKIGEAIIPDHKTVSEALGENKDKLDEYYKTADAIDEIIKKISNGDYTDIDLAQWRVEYDLVGETAEELTSELNKTKDEAKEAAIAVLDKLIEANPNDKELIKSLNQIKESLENISEESKKLKGNANIANIVEEFEKLSGLYETFKENSKSGTLTTPISISDVEALREVWGDLASFEEFERLITTTGSSAAEVEAAFDQLSTEFANTEIDINHITEATKAQIASQLELAGATKESAQAFVDYYANANKVKQELDSSQIFNELTNDAQKQIGVIEDTKKQLEKLQEGGNVDLTIRPTVDTKELEDAGWEDVGEGIATVFSSSFTDDLGKKTINFTPIIVDENGNKVDILSPEAFDEYCFNVVNGVHDDYLKLQIGAEFDDPEEAGRVADEIHRLHEVYYNLVDPIELANDAIDGNKQKLEEEAEQLGITTQALAYYVFEEQIADMAKIDTASEVSSLIALAGQANITGECLEKLIELEEIYIGLESGVYGKGTEDMAKAMTRANQLQKEIQDLYDKGAVKPEIKVDKNAPKLDFNGAKGKGGSGSEQTPETFDWIETKIQRLERDITNLGKTADATYKTWAERTVALGQEMEKVNEQISLQESAYNAYMAKAESVGLSAQYKKLVQSGALKIDEITDETLKEQISNYKEWYEKALDAKDKIDDLKQSLAELAKTKFDNISAQFDDLISDIDHFVKFINAQLTSVETIGKIGGKSFYEALIAQEQQRVNELTAELAQLQNALAEGLASGAIEYGSQMWAEMKKQIFSVEEAIWDANNAILEFEQKLKQVAKQNFDDLLKQFNNAIEILTSKIDLTDKIISMVESTGHIVSKRYYESLAEAEDQNIKNLKKKYDELQKVFDEAVANGDITPYSDDWYSMKEQIESVKGEIIDAANALIEYKNALRQIEWDLFDRGQTRLEQLVSESQFLIDLYSKYPLFDKETGEITDKGMATRGLLVQNYETYKQQAAQLAEEIAKLKEELEADPKNVTLIDRLRELEQAERDAILASEGVKESLRDLLENEINALLEALQKLVDQYKKNLQAQKD